jgi:hypothetical protein
MKIISSSLAFVLFVMLVILTPEPAVSKASPARTMFAATCFCKISKDNLTNLNSASGVLLDLTGAVGKTYTGLFQQSDANQTDCNTRCTSAAASYTGSQSIATAACAAGANNGTVVRAWSAVGTREYKSAQQIGVLQKQAQVSQTTCTCPPTWLSSTTNVPGGVTGDGKCKKEAGSCLNISPLPPNGTQIGSWGFTWGNSLVAYGSSANGGAATCVTTIVSPAICKF